MEIVKYEYVGPERRLKVVFVMIHKDLRHQVDSDSGGAHPATA
jgi:hypothetical protein